MNQFLIKILIAIILFAVIGCQSEYDEYVKKEMASSVFHDSLIFDMRLGMTKKDFYAVCWDLNKQQIIGQGTGNQYARYLEPVDSLKNGEQRKQMDFFGIFEDDIMHGMEMIYIYHAWAPWNQNLQSAQLATELKAIYGRKYPGNPFIEIDLKTSDYKALAKIDGNRQILIYPKNDKEVVVLIEDLNFKYNKQ